MNGDYQREDINEDWHLDTSSENDTKEAHRVDLYWHQTDQTQDMLGEKKYPKLMSVVKSLLVLAHGNADIERGISDIRKNSTE